MKSIKNITVALVALGLVLVPAFAYAETELGTNQQNRKDLKEAREDFVQSKGEAKAEFKDAIEEHRDALRSEFSGLTKAERKSKISEMRTDINAKLLARLGTFTDKAVNLFEKTVTRMNAFANKVDTLIKRLEDKHEGLNLTNAKTLLATAKTKIALITTSLPKLQSDADAIIAGSENAVTAFKEIKDLIKTFKDEKVMVAHDALIEATKAVKAGVPQND